MGHPQETLDFPFRTLLPSWTPAMQQLGSGRADLHQVVEAVDVGNEIGRKDGAVLGSAPHHKLLPEPAAEDTRVTLTAGDGSSSVYPATSGGTGGWPNLSSLYADMFFPAVVT